VNADFERRHRRSIRLRGYDYTLAGAYFLTICARDRSCIFADVEDGAARLTTVGEVVASCWEAIPGHFPSTELDAYVVMPNHLHGIVVIDTRVRAGTGVAMEPDTASRVPPDGHAEQFGKPVAGSVPTIVRSFKSAVTKSINDYPGRAEACHAFLAGRFGPVPPGRIPSPWQSRYYEHIIRNDRALDSIRAYITSNPARWTEDSLHPDHPHPGMATRLRHDRRL
jgi:putative transposase